MNIVAESCSYSYPIRRPALRSVSFHIDEFPAVVLGPNGAGKSTLLRLLTTQLHLRVGELSLDGTSIRSPGGRRAIRAKVGYLPQSVYPIPGLRVREQVAYSGWLRGMSKSEAWDGSADALARVDLSAQSAFSAGRISGGQLRRLGVAQAIVHEPRILVLDEPYAGLDPSQRSGLRELIRELSAGMSIVTSTHQTEDLADLYRSVLILAEGGVAFCGAVDGFLTGERDSIRSSQGELAYRRLLGE